MESASPLQASGNRFSSNQMSSPRRATMPKVGRLDGLVNTGIVRARSGLKQMGNFRKGAFAVRSCRFRQSAGRQDELEAVNSRRRFCTKSVPQGLSRASRMDAGAGDRRTGPGQGFPRFWSDRLLQVRGDGAGDAFAAPGRQNLHRLRRARIVDNRTARIGSWPRSALAIDLPCGNAGAGFRSRGII